MTFSGHVCSKWRSGAEVSWRDGAPPWDVIDNRFAMVADLGLDEILVYRSDVASP